VGHAAEVWGRLTEMLEKGDVKDLPSLYGPDSIFLEPYNPPHRGNLLIQAYLKDFLGGKGDVDVADERVVESADGRYLAVEWTISYTAAGRRWKELPRASFLEFDDDGRIVYHREYS
jgi:ketosteroid isomerase-like protein